MKHTRFAQESAAQAQAEAREKQAQHTPGPWRWHDEFILAGGDVGTRKGKCIAVSVGGFHWETEPEKEANARLIAAAPELLEALRGLVAMVRNSRVDDGSTWTENDGSAFSAAEQAIAKATGK